MLLTVCRRYARDEAMAKDLLQETLIKIFKGIHKYQPTGSFEGWMRRIAVNCSLAWIQKSSYKNEYPTIDFGEPAQQPVIFSDLAEEEIIRKIQALSPAIRAVVNLSLIEGYKHKEIAMLLNISENTSRSYLMRGRELLKKNLLEDSRIRKSA